MSLRLEPLENLSEAVQARLAHPIQRVGPLDLTEVGRSIAACGVEDVCLAVHILDHEVLPLESNATFDLISPESMNRMRNISPASTRAGVSICAFLPRKYVYTKVAGKQTVNKLRRVQISNSSSSFCQQLSKLTQSGCSVVSTG